MFNCIQTYAVVKLTNRTGQCWRQVNVIPKETLECHLYIQVKKLLKGHGTATS